MSYHKHTVTLESTTGQISSPGLDSLIPSFNHQRYIPFGLDSDVTGELLPMFPQIIRDKGNATTPLIASRLSFIDKPGVSKGILNGQAYTNTIHGIHDVASAINLAVSAPPSSYLSLRDQAVAQAVSSMNQKVRNYQSPFQGQIFAGELRETVELLRHPLEKSHKLVETLLHNKKRFPKAVADSWLEFRFGVLPLISDINSVVDTLLGLSSQDDSRAFKAYGHSELDEGSSQLSGVDQLWPGVVEHGFLQQLSSTYKVENFIRMGVVWEHMDRFVDVSSRFKNSIDQFSDLAVTAWELVPWSFLVDYFVNVGDIIEGGTSQGYHTSWVSNSLVTTRTVVFKSLSTSAFPLWNGPAFDFEVSFIPRELQFTNRNVNRDGAFSAIPPIVFHLPGSNIRYANISALIASNLL